MKNMNNENRPSLAAIRNMIKEAEQKGMKDIINLAIGEPDFSVPDCIRKAAIEKIKNGGKEISEYTETFGIKPLRQAIADRFNNESGKGKWHAKNVIVTPGAIFALAAAIRAAVVSDIDSNNKPAVLILNPSWSTYVSQVRLMNAVPIFVDIFQKEITLEMLEEAAKGSNLKAIIINSPSNPTGKVLRIQELEIISSFAENHNIWIISDEIYCRISYISIPPPIAIIAPKRTITINGFSKEFAMTGWRLGWAVAPEQIIFEMGLFQSNLVICSSSIIQHAGLFALKSGEAKKAVNIMSQEFAKRREIMAEKLAQIPGLIFQKPDGAFYFFINVKKYLSKNIKTSEMLADYLFNKVRVAVAPGSVFGIEGYMRLSFAASENDICEAIERIKVALLKLK